MTGKVDLALAGAWIVIAAIILWRRKEALKHGLIVLSRFRAIKHVASTIRSFSLPYIVLDILGILGSVSFFALLLIIGWHVII